MYSHSWLEVRDSCVPRQLYFLFCWFQGVTRCPQNSKTPLWEIVSTCKESHNHSSLPTAHPAVCTDSSSTKRGVKELKAPHWPELQGLLSICQIYTPTWAAVIHLELNVKIGGDVDGYSSGSSKLSTNGGKKQTLYSGCVCPATRRHTYF